MNLALHVAGVGSHPRIVDAIFDRVALLVGRFGRRDFRDGSILLCTKDKSDDRGDESSPSQRAARHEG